MDFLITGMVAMAVIGEARAKPTAKFFEAVAQVESGGNDWLIGDKHLRQKAYGRYQIRQPVCDDYNRAHKTNIRAADLRGQAKDLLARKICQWYVISNTPKKLLARVKKNERKEETMWQAVKIIILAISCTLALW